MNFFGNFIKGKDSVDLPSHLDREEPSSGQNISGILNRLGILGWEKIEPLIIAGVCADLPILFIGRHGGCKSDGAAAITRALIGENAIFRSYYVPILCIDDLLGYPVPNSLNEGTVRFAHTPLTIWNAHGVLFDEINRASPSAQSKIMEIIRTKKVMEMPTAVKHVFAAVNPPKEYNSGYMDLAQSSRFFSVQIPNSSMLSEDSLTNIMLGSVGSSPELLSNFIQEVRAIKFSSSDLRRLAELVKRIAVKLNTNTQKKIKFEPRQMVYLFKLFTAMQAMKALKYPFHHDYFVLAALGMIPEVNGITREECDLGLASSLIRAEVTNFELADPLTGVVDLADLLEADIDDPLSWSSNVIEAIKNTSEEKVLRKTISHVKNNKDLDTQLSGSIIGHISLQLYKRKALTQDLSIRSLISTAQQEGIAS